METWAEVNEENYLKLNALGTPVATIRSVGKGRHHAKDDQMGQIPRVAWLAVGSRVMLTKNQEIEMTILGLNNGAMGTVISICYAEGKSPPDFPECVVIDFPRYKGPHWLESHPTWVPIPLNGGKCQDSLCNCRRQGMPFIPGYAIPIAKSQGMTIKAGSDIEYSRVKFQSHIRMEAKNLGTTYVALSRVDREARWALVAPVPHERIAYINSHKKMEGRRVEERRLQVMSDRTVSEYISFADDTDAYLQLLREFDDCCDDNIVASHCVEDDGCNCIICNSVDQ